ncbi:unnamed protein product, partial [Symbiodinium sp. CCMP2456]
MGKKDSGRKPSSKPSKGAAKVKKELKDVKSVKKKARERSSSSAASENKSSTSDDHSNPELEQAKKQLQTVALSFGLKPKNLEINKRTQTQLKDLNSGQLATTLTGLCPQLTA